MFGSCPDRRRDAGFTLIEMLVALAIFSLAALALLRLEGIALTGTQRLGGATVASIVARNLAVDLFTDPKAPAIGHDEGFVDNAGVRWHWRRAVSRTDDARILRIDLAVRSTESGGGVARLTLVRDEQ